MVAKAKSRVNKVSNPITPKSEPSAFKPTTISQSVQMNVTIVQVEAYNQEHAKRVVAAIYKVDLGAVLKATVVPGQSLPPAPKKTQHADIPQRGTRSWETEYQIWTYAQRLVVGLNKFTYIGLEFVKGGFSEKTPAVAEMKAMALKHKLPMMVQIHKVLVKDSNVTALAEPDTGMMTFRVEFNSSSV